MRLQLIVALVAAASLTTSAAAHAQSSFESKLQVYADDDHTQVISPVIEGHAELGEHDTLDAGYLVDAVTSASIDVVSQASPTTIHDVRHQANVSGAHRFEDTTARAGYTYSTENDYDSHNLNVGLQRTFDGKNTTFAAGYGISVNTVGMVDDRTFGRDLTIHRVTTSWTQIVTPRLATQLGYELAVAHGFQASPYRFVPVRTSDGAAPEMWVPEADPDDRVRHAVVVGANRHLAGSGALQGDYRIYRDTWGITSHTIGARWFVDLTDDVELRLRSRFYVQDGASFYRARYDRLERYMTVDRELSAMWSETVGGKLMWKLGERLEAEAKLDGFYYRYAEFPALVSRVGMNAGLGLTLTY